MSALAATTAPSSTTARTSPVALACEARMFEAWRALSEAEQTPGVPVSLLDRLYAQYLLALYQLVETVRRETEREERESEARA